MSEQEGRLRWRRVRPGLYERIDTPRSVPISTEFLDRIRDESPWLADFLERADARPDDGADRAREG
jgi:hypothetical protein